jgi:hypothetical protein
MRYAPFTEQEVDRINAFQRCDRVHPFTCGNSACKSRELVATRDGMDCPVCGSRQRWVHEFMAEWTG